MMLFVSSLHTRRCRLKSIAFICVLSFLASTCLATSPRLTSLEDYYSRDASDSEGNRLAASNSQQQSSTGIQVNAIAILHVQIEHTLHSDHLPTSRDVQQDWLVDVQDLDDREFGTKSLVSWNDWTVPPGDYASSRWLRKGNVILVMGPEDHHNHNGSTKSKQEKQSAIPQARALLVTLVESSGVVPSIASDAAASTEGGSSSSTFHRVHTRRLAEFPRAIPVLNPSPSRKSHSRHYVNVTMAIETHSAETETHAVGSNVFGSWRYLALLSSVSLCLLWIQNKLGVGSWSKYSGTCSESWTATSDDTILPETDEESYHTKRAWSLAELRDELQRRDRSEDAAQEYYTAKRRWSLEELREECQRRQAQAQHQTTVDPGTRHTSNYSGNADDAVESANASFQHSTLSEKVERLFSQNQDDEIEADDPASEMDKAVCIVSASKAYNQTNDEDTPDLKVTVTVDDVNTNEPKGSDCSSAIERGAHVTNEETTKLLALPIVTIQRKERQDSPIIAPSPLTYYHSGDGEDDFEIGAVLPRVIFHNPNSSSHGAEIYPEPAYELSEKSRTGSDCDDVVARDAESKKGHSAILGCNDEPLPTDSSKDFGTPNSATKSKGSNLEVSDEACTAPALSIPNSNFTALPSSMECTEQEHKCPAISGESPCRNVHDSINEHDGLSVEKQSNVDHSNKYPNSAKVHGPGGESFVETRIEEFPKESFEETCESIAASVETEEEVHSGQKRKRNTYENDDESVVSSVSTLPSDTDHRISDADYSTFQVRPMEVPSSSQAAETMRVVTNSSPYQENAVERTSNLNSEDDENVSESSKTKSVRIKFESTSSVDGNCSDSSIEFLRVVPGKLKRVRRRTKRAVFPDYAPSNRLQSAPRQLISRYPLRKRSSRPI